MGTKQFISTLQTVVKRSGKPIKQLLLTHAHTDHANGVPAFHQVFPHAQIGISKRDARLLAGDFSLTDDEDSHPIKGGFTKANIPIDFTFSDNTNIDDWKVVATPGHTPGSASFYQPETNIIVVGDAFQIKGGIAVVGALRWRFPFPAKATWSPTTAINSAQHLLQLSPRLLAVGHGSMLVNPQEIMQQAIKSAKKKAQ